MTHIIIEEYVYLLLCSMMNNRLQLYCQKYNLINKNQIGFKKNHRTSDHLLTLKAIVKKYLTIGKKKAFHMFC